MSPTENNTCIVCAQLFLSSEERDEHEMGQHFCENGVLDLIFSKYDEFTERVRKHRQSEDGDAWAGHNLRMNKVKTFWTHNMQAIRDDRERLVASRSAIELVIQDHQKTLRDLSSQLDANAESEARLAQQCDIKENQEAERFKVEREGRRVQRHHEDFNTYNIFLDGVVSATLKPGRAHCGCLTSTQRRAHVGSKRKVQQACWGEFPSQKLQPAEYVSVAAEALQMMSYSKEMTAAAERAGIEVGAQMATEQAGVKGNSQTEVEDIRSPSQRQEEDVTDDEIVVMAE